MSGARRYQALRPQRPWSRRPFRQSRTIRLCPAPGAHCSPLTMARRLKRWQAFRQEVLRQIPRREARSRIAVAPMTQRPAVFRTL